MNSSLETLADTQMLHYVQHDKSGVSCPRYATRGIGNSAEPVDLLIRRCHALIFDAQGQPTIRLDQDILIAGPQIIAVQQTSDPTPAACAVIDARGLLALPGLINTHCHAPMVLFRGLAEDLSIDRWFNEIIWPVESNLTQEDVYWGMFLALAEMIESGVTTIADHYFFMDQAARAVSEAGTRALLGWAIFSSQGDAGLTTAAEFVAAWHGQSDGRIAACMAPHAPYTCDDDYLRAAVAYAEQLKVGIHIHAAENMSQTQSSLERRGVTPIRVLEETGVLSRPTIIAHGCGILPADIEILRPYAAHVGVAHAPKTYLKLAAGMTPISALRAAGVSVGLASDGAASNNTLDILESLRLMALIQKQIADDPEAMPVGEALTIAFCGGATALGMGERLGQLAPGFLADLILVDVSGVHHQPLHNMLATIIYNLRASDVDTTIVNGRVLMQGRRLLTLDKQEIIAQVNKSMARLAQRVPGRRIQVYNP
jgi:5-methylthioadenosine/S-adenosylhomocysteine deaminase